MGILKGLLDGIGVEHIEKTFSSSDGPASLGPYPFVNEPCMESKLMRAIHLILGRQHKSLCHVYVLQTYTTSSLQGEKP